MSDSGEVVTAIPAPSTNDSLSSSGSLSSSSSSSSSLGRMQGRRKGPKGKRKDSTRLQSGSGSRRSGRASPSSPQLTQATIAESVPLGQGDISMMERVLRQEERAQTKANVLLLQQSKQNQQQTGGGGDGNHTSGEGNTPSGVGTTSKKHAVNVDLRKTVKSIPRAREDAIPALVVQNHLESGSKFHQPDPHWHRAPRMPSHMATFEPNLMKREKINKKSVFKNPVKYHKMVEKRQQEINKIGARGTKTRLTVTEFEEIALQISKGRRMDEVLWLDILYPSPAILRIIHKNFRLHPLTIEDCLNVHEEEQNEKNELFPGYRFVVMVETHAVPASNELRSVVLNVIGSDSFCITMHQGPSLSQEIVLSRIRDHIKSPDWLMYGHFDAITDILVLFVKLLVLEVEEIESLVLSLSASGQNELLRRIGVARKRGVLLWSELTSKETVLQSLISSSSPSVLYARNLSADIIVYLRDVLDHVHKMLKEIDVTRDTLNNLNNTYLARVSIEMAGASNKMNSVMKKFGAYATILLPLTLIAGLWGMNIPVPGQESTKVTDYGYFMIILGLMLTFTVGCVIYFKKAKWL